MKEIDVHYWMKNVELPQIRGVLILEFLDLMDGYYQEKDWVERDKKEYVYNDDKSTRFHANFSFCVESFDDLDLYQNIKDKKIPYQLLGECLKTSQEAEKLYEVVYYSDKLMKDAFKGRSSWYYTPTNQEYLLSPNIELMRKAAGEAFKIFMENEKDNKEFCEFIAALKEKRIREGLSKA